MVLGCRDLCRLLVTVLTHKEQLYLALGNWALFQILLPVIHWSPVTVLRWPAEARARVRRLRNITSFSDMAGFPRLESIRLQSNFYNSPMPFRLIRPDIMSMDCGHLHPYPYHAGFFPRVMDSLVIGGAYTIMDGAFPKSCRVLDLGEGVAINGALTQLPQDLQILRMGPSSPLMKQLPRTLRQL